MSMLSKLKKIIEYVDSTSPGARVITYSGLIISCVFLIFALLITVCTEELSAETYRQYYMMRELLADGWLVLLISIFGAGCIEDAANR